MACVVWCLIELWKKILKYFFNKKEMHVRRTLTNIWFIKSFNLFVSNKLHTCNDVNINCYVTPLSECKWQWGRRKVMCGQILKNHEHGVIRFITKLIACFHIFSSCPLYMQLLNNIHISPKYHTYLYNLLHTKQNKRVFKGSRRKLSTMNHVETTSSCMAISTC